MKDSIKSYIEKLKRDKSYRRRVLGVICVLAIFVAGGVFWQLRIIGITMANQPMCGLEEHIHSEDECGVISKTLICGYDDINDINEVDGIDEITTVKELACQLEIHVHTDDCFDEEGEVICGYADYVIHQHDEMCFDADGLLVCALPEIYPHKHEEECYDLSCLYSCGLSEIPVAVHEHTDECFTEANVLICGIEEDDDHTHTDECHEIRYLLTCDLATEAFHTHDINCVYPDKIPVYLEMLERASLLMQGLPVDDEPLAYCGMMQVIYHIHNDEFDPEHPEEYCYDLETGELICGLLETDWHQHDETCWIETIVEDASENGDTINNGILALSNVNNGFIDEEVDLGTEPIDGSLGAHVHTPECYEIIYACGKPEHTHKLSCYADFSRDVESVSDWVNMTSAARAEIDQYFGGSEEVPPYFYLISIAQSQVGYQESEFNFKLIDGVRKGYNRYSDWFTGGQNPYSDWNASFVAFCLHYAGINNIPVSLGVNAWQVMLEAEDLFIPVENTVLYTGDMEDHFPSPGDIIFLDTDYDGYADRVGIISDYGETEDFDTTFVVIEGDCSLDPFGNIMQGVELYDENIDPVFGEELVNVNGFTSSNEPYTYESIICDTVSYREYDLFDPAIVGFVTIAEIPEISTLAAYTSPKPYNELAYAENYLGDPVVAGDYSDLEDLGNFALVGVNTVTTTDTTTTVRNVTIHTGDDSDYRHWIVEAVGLGETVSSGGTSDRVVYSNSGSISGFSGVRRTALTIPSDYNGSGDIVDVSLGRTLTAGETITIRITGKSVGDFRFWVGRNNHNSSQIVPVQPNNGNFEVEHTFTVNEKDGDNPETAFNVEFKGPTYDTPLNGLVINSVEIATPSTDDAVLYAAWETIAINSDNPSSGGSPHTLYNSSITIDEIKSILKAGGSTFTITYTGNPINDDWANYGIPTIGVYAPGHGYTSEVVIPLTLSSSGGVNTATIALDDLVAKLNAANCSIDDIRALSVQPFCDSGFKIQSVTFTSPSTLPTPMKVKLKQTIAGRTFYLTQSGGVLGLSESYGTEWNLIKGTYNGEAGWAVICTHWGEEHPANEADKWKSYYLVYDNGTFSLALADCGTDGEKPKAISSTSFNLDNCYPKAPFHIFGSGTYDQGNLSAMDGISFEIVSSNFANNLHIDADVIVNTTYNSTDTFRVVSQTAGLTRGNPVSGASENLLPNAAELATWYLEAGQPDNEGIITYHLYTYNDKGEKQSLRIITHDDSNPATEGDVFIASTGGDDGLQLFTFDLNHVNVSDVIGSRWWGRALILENNFFKAPQPSNMSTLAKFYFYNVNGERITSVDPGSTTQIAVINYGDGQYYPLATGFDTKKRLGAVGVNLSNTTAVERYMVWDAMPFNDNHIDTQNRIRLAGNSYYIPIYDTDNGTADYSYLTLSDHYAGMGGSKFDFITVKGAGANGVDDYVLIRALGPGNGTTNHYLRLDSNNNLCYVDYDSEAEAMADSSTHFRIYINDPRDTYNPDRILDPLSHLTTVGYQHWNKNETFELRLSIGVGEEQKIDLTSSIFDPNGSGIALGSFEAVEDAAALDANEHIINNQNNHGTTYYYFGDQSVALALYEKGDEMKNDVRTLCDTLHLVGRTAGTTDLIIKTFIGYDVDPNSNEKRPKFNTLIVHLQVGDEPERIFAGYDNRYYHLDVEVDADFDILIYGAGGQITKIKPQNVQVQSVYAKVYNTARYYNADNQLVPAKWNQDYYEHPTDYFSGIRSLQGFGLPYHWGFANPHNYPWILYKSSADNKYYPAINGTSYIYDEYVTYDGSGIFDDNHLQPDATAMKAYLDQGWSSPVTIGMLANAGFIKKTGENAYQTKPSPPNADRFYNHAYGPGQPFRFGTDPNGNTLETKEDIHSGYTVHDSYGEFDDIQSVYVGYNQRGVAANGQFEFLTYGWGLMEFYDGDSVDLYVSVSYEYNGKTYYTTRTVKSVICDYNNVCPAIYEVDNKDVHGFDVEVIFEDVIEIESTGILKSDQYGNALPGAEFAIYKSDSDGNIREVRDNGTVISEVDIPLFTAVTDADGKFRFLNNDGQILTMAELYNAFHYEGSEEPYFILRETKVPTGYRPIPKDALFRFVLGGDRNGHDLDPTGSYTFVICDNSYETGVRSNPNALIQAPKKIYRTDIDQMIEYYDEVTTHTPLPDGKYYDITTLETHGELYAVVMKRRGVGLEDFDHGTPVYGNDYDGYEFWDMSGGKTAAQAVEEMLADPIASQGVYKFNISSTGLTVLTSVKEIPGEIERYFDYQMAVNRHMDENTQEYAIGFFYRSEDSDSTHLVRVDPRYDFGTGLGASTTPDGSRDDKFDVHWTTTIEVPDIENRLFYQKKDQDGILLDNAVFALYNVEEYTIGGEKVIGYRATNGDYYRLFDYDPYTNRGKAQRINTYSNTLDPAVFNFHINTWADPNNAVQGYVSEVYCGQMYIDVDGGTVYINPARNNEQFKSYVGITHKACNIVGTGGTGHFGKIPSGKYVLREIIAPSGYLVNTAETLVLVDELGVYANAGTSDNGVRVGNGAGYLVAPMNAYATIASVDDSLAWIYMQSVGNNGTTFDSFGNVKTWDLVNDSVDFEGRRSNGVSYLVYDGFDIYNPEHKIDLPSINPDQTYFEDNGVSLFDYRTSRDQAESGNSVWLYDPVTKEFTQYTKGDNTSDNTSYSRPTGSGDGVAFLEGNSNSMPPSLVLYDDDGWSAVRISQDSYYGSVASNLNHAEYKILTDTGALGGTPMNITDIYSGSTFVEVTDNGASDLIIVKSFDNIPDNDTDAERPNAKFTLSKNVNSNVVSAPPAGRVENGDDPFWAVTLPSAVDVSHGAKITYTIEGTATGTGSIRTFFNVTTHLNSNNVNDPVTTTLDSDGHFSATIEVTVNQNKIPDDGRSKIADKLIFRSAWSEKFTSFELTKCEFTVSDGASTLYYQPNGTWAATPAEIETSEIFASTPTTTVQGYYDGKTIESSVPSDYTINGATPTLQTRTITSTVTGRDISFYVALPDGYNENEKYPVVYLYHGWNCNKDNLTGLAVIAQKMAAANAAEKMILVFPDINTMGVNTDVTYENELSYDYITDVLPVDIMPYIEENYSIKTGKDNTALYGWSMGGREALATAITYPEMFGYVAACEPAPGLLQANDGNFHMGMFRQASDLNFRGMDPYFLMIVSGNNDNVVNPYPTTYHEIFENNGVPHLYATINSGHGDPATSATFYNFAKYLFKTPHDYHNKGIRFDNLTTGTYTLTEVSESSGTYGVLPPMTVTVAADGKITIVDDNGSEVATRQLHFWDSDYTVQGATTITQYGATLVNISGTTDLSIKKSPKGADHWVNQLEGAEFILYYDVEETDEGGNVIGTIRYYYNNYTVVNGKNVALWTSDRNEADTIIPNGWNGTYAGGGLTPENNPCVRGLTRDMTYYLVETKAPDGYNLLPTPIVINIDKDGHLVKEDGTTKYQPLKAMVEGVVDLVYDAKDGDTRNVIQITVFNAPGFALPQTGGPGTLIYTLGGAMLMIIALAYPLVCGKVRHRRERRAVR